MSNMVQKIVYLSKEEQVEFDALHQHLAADNKLRTDVQFNCAPSNIAPVGWREVDEEYMATRSLMRTYTPKFVEYRGITTLPDGTPMLNLKGEPEYTGVHLYYFHDGTGAAMYFDYWAKRIRWFAFGCEHKYVEISRPANHRSGLHSDKCEKCGNVNTYDTSD